MIEVTARLDQIAKQLGRIADALERPAIIVPFVDPIAASVAEPAIDPPAAAEPIVEPATSNTP